MYKKNIQQHTHELVLADGFKAIDKRKRGENCINVRGIKGLSTLLLLKGIDIVKSLPIDSMHALLRGLTGSSLNMWFDSKNNKRKFYIGRPHQVEIVDANLNMIRPSKSFTRYPRPIGD